jgi:cell division protein FtsB
MGEIIEELEYDFKIQEELTERWHLEEGDMQDEYESIMSSGQAIKPADVIAVQHFMNYSLWHIEDTARRRDVEASVIADCKYKIDVFNQKRNNLIEKIDEAITNAIYQNLPQDPQEKYNTETLGMAIDRMSIIALKIYHMREQTLRSDVSQEHREKCDAKLSQLSEQRERLKQSIFDLIDDYFAGRKAVKPFFQHKMYNDNNLNPELYGNHAANREPRKL